MSFSASLSVIHFVSDQQEPPSTSRGFIHLVVRQLSSVLIQSANEPGHTFTLM